VLKSIKGIVSSFVNYHQKKTSFGADKTLPAPSTIRLKTYYLMFFLAEQQHMFWNVLHFFSPKVSCKTLCPCTCVLQHLSALLLLRNVVRDPCSFFSLFSLEAKFLCVVLCKWQRSGRVVLLCMYFAHSSIMEFRMLGADNQVFAPGITTSMHSPGWQQN